MKKNQRPKDKNKVRIQIGDGVIVPDPDVDDVWNNSFTGVVVGFNKDFTLVTVEDQEADCFSVEPNKLEVL